MPMCQCAVDYPATLLPWHIGMNFNRNTAICRYANANSLEHVGDFMMEQGRAHAKSVADEAHFAPREAWGSYDEKMQRRIK